MSRARNAPTLRGRCFEGAMQSSGEKAMARCSAGKLVLGPTSLRLETGSGAGPRRLQGLPLRGARRPWQRRSGRPYPLKADGRRRAAREGSALDRRCRRLRAPCARSSRGSRPARSGRRHEPVGRGRPVRRGRQDRGRGASSRKGPPFEIETTHLCASLRLSHRPRGHLRLRDAGRRAADSSSGPRIRRCTGGRGLARASWPVGPRKAQPAFAWRAGDATAVAFAPRVRWPSYAPASS